MSVKLVKEVPKATRNRVSPIKLTKDWRDALERIKAGDFTALKIDFDPTTLALGKSTADRFRRLLQAELKSIGVRGVRLTFRKSEAGVPILFVVRRRARKEEPCSKP
jgi:hypothetical protein